MFPPWRFYHVKKSLVLILPISISYTLFVYVIILFHIIHLWCIVKQDFVKCDLWIHLIDHFCIYDSFVYCNFCIVIFNHSCNSLNIYWNTSILCCWVYLFLYLIQLGDIHRLCLHDYIHILSMYVFLGLFVVCKATLRDKRKFVQGIEKGVKTYSPPL